MLQYVRASVCLSHSLGGSTVCLRCGPADIGGVSLRHVIPCSNLYHKIGELRHYFFVFH